MIGKQMSAGYGWDVSINKFAQIYVNEKLSQTKH